jgi:hypothetical protein
MRRALMTNLRCTTMKATIEMMLIGPILGEASRATRMGTRMDRAINITIIPIRLSVMLRSWIVTTICGETRRDRSASAEVSNRDMISSFDYGYASFPYCDGAALCRLATHTRLYRHFSLPISSLSFSFLIWGFFFVRRVLDCGVCDRGHSVSWDFFLFWSLQVSFLYV